MQHWLVERNHPKDQRELHFQDFFNSVQAFTDSDASLSGRTGSRLVCETLIIILFHPHTNIWLIFGIEFLSSGQTGTLVWTNPKSIFPMKWSHLKDYIGKMMIADFHDCNADCPPDCKYKDTTSAHSRFKINHFYIIILYNSYFKLYHFF